MEQQEITFNEAIINAFVNGPADFTRYEDHDIEYFSDLRQRDNVLKSDKKLLNEALRKSTIIGCKAAGKKSLPYVYEKGQSNYSANFSLLGLSKEFKKNVFAFYKSLNIVNRNYTIINGIAAMNGINFPRIQEYVDRYEEVWRTENSTKKEFWDLIHHPIISNYDSPFIGQLVDELHEVQQRFQHRGFTHMQIIEIYSTFIINCVYEYLINNGIIENEHCSLGNNAIYFLPLRAFDVKTEKENIEHYVSERTGFAVRFHDDSLND